jgi:ACS family tartrate transporter-like MFS transporter
LLEGLPAVFLGIATLLFLPDRPDEARWLRDNEREWLLRKLARERQAAATGEQVTISRALRQWPVLVLTLALLFCYAGGYAFWFWMPTMLQRITGWADLQRVGLVTAIPFVAGLAGMLLVGRNSDRTGERRWHFAFPQMTAAAALVAWFFLPHSSVVLIIIFTLVGFGTSAHLPAFWALPTTFLSASAAAAAIGFINCIGSIGGFFGPKLIGTLSQRTGSFDAGFALIIACLVIAAALVLLCPRQRRV